MLQVQPLGWQLQISPPLTSSLEPITLTMELVGASSPAAWESSLPLVTTVSDYRSPDSSRWRSELPQYQQIQARSIYPQIDLQYTVTPSSTLKSSYLVAAGADPSQINWRYPNALDVEIANDGSLVIHVNATTTITESAPIAWQDLGEDRVFVPVAFQLAADGTVGFVVGAYDPSQPLVLDPSLTINRVFGAGLRTVSNLARHPNGQYYLAGAGDSGAVLWRIGSDGQTPLGSTLLGSLGTVARVAVTAGGMIVVGVGSYGTEYPQPVQILRFATPTSVPVVETIANGMIDDLVAHPSIEQVWMTWRNLPSGMGTVTTITPSVASHIATTAPLIVYRHLAVNSSGILYGSFSRSTVTSGGFSNPSSAGVSRWTGTAWQIVYERVPSGNSSAWLSGPLALDSTGNVWVAMHELVKDPGVYEFMRLWALSITPTGSVPIIRVLSDEVPILGHYHGTTALALTVLSTGEIMLGGRTHGLTSATRILGEQRGFVVTLQADGAVLERNEFQDSPNYEQWIVDLIEAGDAILVAGDQTAGGNNAGFLGQLSLASAQAVTAPRYTVSYYETVNDPQVFFKQGCRAYENREDGIIFLFFGAPTPNGATGYGSNPSFDDIERNVLKFIEGYKSNGACGMFSRRTDLSLSIAVSTSNSYLGDGQENPSVNESHGEEWAERVVRIADEVHDRNFKNITVVGGLDAEINWDTAHAGNTSEWIDGYSGIANPRYLYIFGSMDGGPRIGFPNQDNWPSDKIAALEQAYDWNFSRAITRAVPQIYNASYAQEWYQMRQYLIRKKHKPLRIFDGVMSQCGSSSECPPYPYTNNDWEAYDTCLDDIYATLEPTAGWQAFHQRLNYTLRNDLTLTQPFQLPRRYRVSEKMQIAIPGQGTFNTCESIPAQLLPTNTVFGRGNIFAYTTSTPKSQWTDETKQTLRWVTDIFWTTEQSPTAPKR